MLFLQVVLVVALLSLLNFCFKNRVFQDVVRHLWDLYLGYRIVDTGRAMTMDHASTAVRFRIETSGWKEVKDMRVQILGTEAGGYTWMIKVKHPKKQGIEV